MRCKDEDHQVGKIGANLVRRSQWDDAVVVFGKVIDDFNIRGQREQINHPGWCSRFSFCTECGADLRGLVLRDLEINS